MSCDAALHWMMPCDASSVINNVLRCSFALKDVLWYQQCNKQCPVMQVMFWDASDVINNVLWCNDAKNNVLWCNKWCPVMYWTSDAGEAMKRCTHSPFCPPPPVCTWLWALLSVPPSHQMLCCSLFAALKCIAETTLKSLQQKCSQNTWHSTKHPTNSLPGKNSNKTFPPPLPKPQDHVKRHHTGQQCSMYTSPLADSQGLFTDCKRTPRCMWSLLFSLDSSW